jgi:hypothetical protein
MIEKRAIENFHYIKTKNKTLRKNIHKVTFYSISVKLYNY